MGKPVEKKRKKKGRPSLLDLQRRSLRLQKQQQQQSQKQPQGKKAASSPSPNPYLRFPASATPGRRGTRRIPSPEPDGEDDEEEAGGKRREKKLKLVLRLHQGDGGRSAEGEPSGSEVSGSESEGEGGGAPKKRKIDAIGGEEAGSEKTERHNHSSKATDPLQGGPSDSGPTATPLPDEKLLLFVLDRLQKKDTYGVFSEPVDPNELPDYHEVIEHPMDFSTVRKKLSDGYYANLEMFEDVSLSDESPVIHVKSNFQPFKGEKEDVFLICSNAMRYNAPDTIYFRQARSIQELARKNFENLRQESSDDDEPEPKVVRRGRPPNKNTTKKVVGRPTERASSDFSLGVTLANAGESTLWSNSPHDLTRKGFSFDKPGSVDASARANHGLRNSDSCNWMVDKSDRNEESGSVKGILMRSGKKVSILDENRRNTYKLSQSSTCWRESSVLTTFDGERRQLIPQLGIHTEHAYARSLARFAANLGPIGWEIAAKQIEKVLPPGTQFGCGWVGEPDVARRCQPPLPSASPPRPLPQPTTVLPKADATADQLESHSASVAVEGSHLIQTTAFASSSNISSRPSNPMEGTPPVRPLNSDSRLGMASGSAGTAGMRPKAPFQLHQKMAVHPGINGLSNAAFGFDLSQVGNMVRPAKPTGNFITEVVMTHARALDMVSRGDNNFFHPASAAHVEMERQNPSNSGAVNPVNPLSDSSQDLHGGSWRELSLRPKPDSTPPDLNLRFQSSGSSPSNVVVDSQQQPDLALQL